MTNIVDDNRQEHLAYNFLTEGSHFGEIGMLFKCKRTASVVSRNYTTLAGLGSNQFKEVNS